MANTSKVDPRRAEWLEEKRQAELQGRQKRRESEAQAAKYARDREEPDFQYRNHVREASK